MKTKIIAILIVISLLFVFGCTQTNDENNVDAGDDVNTVSLDELDATANGIEQEINEINDLIDSTDLEDGDLGLDENLI